MRVKVATTLLAVIALASGPSAQPAPIEELSSLRSILDATGFSGTVLLYDSKADRLSAINAGTADTRRIPASTFKIFNALVAVDAGILVDARTVMRWDGVTRERTEWNRDLDLKTAFRVSAVPHFQALARRIGVEGMQRAIDAAGYGNRDLGGGLDRFWLAGDLRISPREQIQLLVRLHRSELPFSTHAMAVVREIMEVERTSAFVLRAKTGWATHPDGRHVGWWVGWVERGAEVTFFASVIESPTDHPSFGDARTAVPRAVLRALHILSP